MKEMKATEAHERFAEVVDAAEVHHERVVLTRDGRRVAAVISISDLEDLERYEDEVAHDIQAADALLNDVNETPIPWERAKSDLGL